MNKIIYQPHLYNQQNRAKSSTSENNKNAKFINFKTVSCVCVHFTTSDNNTLYMGKEEYHTGYDQTSIIRI
jgi:hypothetical protein